MIFPYRSIISEAPGSGDFLLLRRPEIPVTIVGAEKSATFVGLVDTGSDHSILPKSIADHLGITVHSDDGPASIVFGGHRVDLMIGEVALRLDADGETLSWITLACFFEFSSDEDETLILGHSGFLEFFTAIFDGQHNLLTLLANSDLPSDF